MLPTASVEASTRLGRHRLLAPIPSMTKAGQSPAFLLLLRITALRSVHGRLRNPPYTMDEYLETLIRQGLVSTVSGLRAFI
jgi:hypothetical protein